MKIGFLIVLYQTPHEETIRLKREIAALGLKNYQIYFIDNTQENRGYAGGVNMAIKQGLHNLIDYFVILNPDVSISPEVGKQLLDGAKHFDVWGGAFEQNGITYFGGELDQRRMSGGLIAKRPNSRFYLCDFVSGSFMVIPKSTIEKIGLFDKSFFLYYEDVEYCQRAKKAGLQVGVDSKISYKHFETSNENINKDWYLAINRLRIMKKYGSIQQKIFELFYIPNTILTLTKAVLKRKSFLANFMSLNISSLLNKILAFLLFVVLIRLLPPHEYGQYTLVWAHTALMMPILDLGTTTYSILNLPNQKSYAFNHVFSLRFFLAIIVFFSTILLSLLFRYEPVIIGYVVLTSIVFFSNSLSGSFLIASSVAEKAYLPALVSVLFQAILVAILIVVLLVGKSLQSLFVTTCLLYGVYAVLNGLLVRKLIGGHTLSLFPESFKIALKDWKIILKGSYVYVLIGFFAGLYFGVDVFLLKFLKGTSEVGKYSAGYKFFDALLFIAASYNITAAPRLAKLKNAGSPLLIKKIITDSLILLTIGTLAVLGVWTVGPNILSLVLEGQYAVSINVLKIVIFALPCILVTSVFLNVLYIFGKQRQVIGLFIFLTIFNILFNVIFIPRFSFFASAYITVIGEIINIVISGLLMMYALRSYESTH